MFKEILFGISSVKEPKFIKEFTADNKQLEDLKELSKKVKEDKRKNIDRDIAMLKYGIDGEKNTDYELKNSFIPMLILHDIRLEREDYVAQMDYILITKYFIMILETKKLSGDISINESGEFVRSFKSKFGKVYKREGIYSPVTQNERHIKILKKILKDNKVCKNIPIYSAVVMANPKSIINKGKAPKDVKDQIVKYDQLGKFIKNKLDVDKKNNSGIVVDKKMYGVAEFLKNNNKEIIFDYMKKYSLSEEDFIEGENLKNSLENKVIEEKSECVEDIYVQAINIENDIEDEVNNKDIIEDVKSELKKFRLAMAKANKVPPYYIFNDATLDEIMDKSPRCLEDLMKIRGFGKVKVERYGENIIEIIEGR
ncbi:MAG: NERD domain-containing protein [Clostridium sp.]|uniref:NERD domain-containing protein n=1 Tax=Clostridium sp. TaxID=1506 RepID=UPI003F3457C4